MRIAVTGASGFVGGAVATALVENGHEVVGFGRRPHGWLHEGARYRMWDLLAGEPLDEGRFDAVVHCAALADDWASRDEALRVNRDGTLEVIARFPGARLVHMSTSSVYDALTPSVNLPESATEGARYLSGYSESKALAEVEATRFGAVILRPHAVYGPGDTTLLPRILAGVRRRGLVLPEGARVPHTLTHIDNLAQAVVLAVEGTASGVVNVGDDGEVILREVLVELLARQGVDVAIRSIPYRAAFAAAAALETLHRATGGRPRLTRYAVSQLGLERTLDLSKARRELGYRPSPTSLAGAESW